MVLVLYLYLLNVFALYINVFKMANDLISKSKHAILELPYKALKYFPSHLAFYLEYKMFDISQNPRPIVTCLYPIF